MHLVHCSTPCMHFCWSSCTCQVQCPCRLTHQPGTCPNSPQPSAAAPAAAFAALTPTILQALLRGVAPGSFPCALGPEPQVTAGLRRFVVIDDNINRLYGQQIRRVSEQRRVVWLGGLGSL